MRPGNLLSAMLPCIAALLLAALVLWATGHAPFVIYGHMLHEAFGSPRQLAATLSAATPLMFTGLATAIAFRAGLFNVGIEGALYLGGLSAACLGYLLAGLPSAALIGLALVGAMLVGALWMLPPALLKTDLQVDEVVSTLMLNFVAFGLCAWAVNGPLLAPGSANSATRSIDMAARLPKLMPPSTLHAGLLLAMALLLLYAAWGRRSIVGFESSLMGLNPRFARAQGLPLRALILKNFMLSGAIAGLAGGTHALGVVHKFTLGFSADYGFTGIAVALLARHHALGILLAAVLFGALASAGTTVQLTHDVPLEISGIIQGAIMVFAVADLARLRWRRRPQ